MVVWQSHWSFSGHLHMFIRLHLTQREVPHFTVHHSNSRAQQTDLTHTKHRGSIQISWMNKALVNESYGNVTASNEICNHFWGTHTHPIYLSSRWVQDSNHAAYAYHVKSSYLNHYVIGWPPWTALSCWDCPFCLSFQRTSFWWKGKTDHRKLSQ